MVNGKTFNRWFVVIGAVLIQLALGAMYAWSVFTKALLEPPYNFSRPQTQAIFSAEVFVFAFVMIFAGIQMKKVGPKPLVVAGGIVLGGGYILGSLLGSSFIMQFLCIGIIGGAGIAGPMLGGFVRDNSGSFLMAFIPAGIVCLVGAVLSLFFRTPIELRKAEIQ